MLFESLSLCAFDGKVALATPYGEVTPVLLAHEDGSTCNLACTELLMCLGVAPFLGLGASGAASVGIGASCFTTSSLWVSMAAM